MKAPRKTALAPQAPRKATAVKSTVKSAQIRPARFTPHMDKQITQTVGANPDPPVTQSASGELDPIVPYSAGSPVSYAPFGIGLDPW